MGDMYLKGWTILKYFMFLFALGYVFIAVFVFLIYFKIIPLIHDPILPPILGTILFCGSIFVYFTVYMGCKTLADFKSNCWR